MATESVVIIVFVLIVLIGLLPIVFIDFFH